MTAEVIVFPKPEPEPEGRACSECGGWGRVEDGARIRECVKCDGTGRTK